MAQSVEHVLGKVKPRKFICHQNLINFSLAAMAQSVEHVLGKDEVTRSNRVSSSKKTAKIISFSGFSLFFATFKPLF